MSTPSPSAARRGGGFDFTQRMWELCHDATGRMAELSHIRMPQVAVSFAQTRSRVLHGLQAKLTPLRFKDGRLTHTRGGRHWTVQRLYDAAGTEMLYILTFYMPRFMNQTPQEKLTTVFHELWHIGTRFDGDLRRFPGRCYAHSSRQSDFDALASELAARWLAARPPERLFRFLWLDFRQLTTRYGRVFGLRIPIPKLLPVVPDGG